MITEIVTFPLKAGAQRADALALYRQTAAKWSENPDLIRKYYFFDEANTIGGGVYIWPSRNAAQRWHGNDYKEMVLRLYGSYPRIELFEVLLEVDPSQKQIVER